MVMWLIFIVIASHIVILRGIERCECIWDIICDVFWVEIAEEDVTLVYVELSVCLDADVVSRLLTGERINKLQRTSPRCDSGNDCEGFWIVINSYIAFIGISGLDGDNIRWKRRIWVSHIDVESWRDVKYALLHADIPTGHWNIDVHLTVDPNRGRNYTPRT